MKKIALLILVLALKPAVQAQLNFESRLEIDLNDEKYHDFKTFVFGENGFILRSEEAKRNTGSIKMKYQSFSNNLQPQKEIVVELEAKRSNLYTSLHTDRHIVEFVYSMSGKAHMNVIDGHNLEVKKYSIDAPAGQTNLLASFAGDYAVIVLSGKKSFNVLSVNVVDGSSHVRPLKIENFKPSRMSIESISSMQNSNEAVICVDVLDKSKKVSGKRVNTYLFFLNCSSGNYKVVDINSKINNTLLTVSAAKIGDDRYIVTGTYTTRMKSSVAEGLFISEMENGKVNFVEYNGFSQLKEFTKYLPERTQARMERKREKIESSGKEAVFSILAVHHPTVITEDSYFILAEYFIPTYRTETQTVNGQRTSRQVFDGYLYTHASLVKYSKEGAMQWDRTFELTPNYKPFVPVRFISLARNSTSGNLTMVYSTRNRIASKSIRTDGSVEYDRNSDEILASFEGDNTKQSFSDVDYWYENYFLLHGYQKIKNTTGETKRKRRVYYVSKLSF